MCAYFCMGLVTCAYMYVHAIWYKLYIGIVFFTFPSLFSLIEKNSGGNNDTTMLHVCASDTSYTTLVTCPISNIDATVKCSSNGGDSLLNSSSVIINEVVTCPDNICLPLLPIDYDDSTV